MKLVLFSTCTMCGRRGQHPLKIIYGANGRKDSACDDCARGRAGMNLERAFYQVVLVAYRQRPTGHWPQLEQIQAAIAARFLLLPGDLKGPQRLRRIARPRQVAMYLSRRLTPRSLPQIGRAFGGRDHTTVIHAIRQIEKLRGEDAELDAHVTALADELSENATSCGLSSLGDQPQAGA